MRIIKRNTKCVIYANIINAVGAVFIMHSEQIIRKQRTDANSFKNHESTVLTKLIFTS